MKGAPIRTIQELAGHASITTTMRYMHLTESAAEAAIQLLDQPNKRQQQTPHATQPGQSVANTGGGLKKA